MNPTTAPNTTTSTDDYKTTPFNTPVSGNALTNDVDPQGDAQKVVPQTITDSTGTFVLNQDGTLYVYSRTRL